MPFDIGGYIYNGTHVDTQDYRNITTRGLVTNLDVSAIESYSGSGADWFDLSGEDYHGTLVNGPTYNSSNGGSLVFDGTNDYVSLGETYKYNLSNEVSSFAWINISSASSWDGVFGSTETSGDFLHFQLYLGGLNVYVYGPNVGYDRIDGNSYITTNTWNEVGFTFGANTLRLYINGVQLATTVSGNGNNIGTATDVRVGRAYSDDRFLGGKIATFRLYNKALTSSEVSNNFNIQKSRFGY